MSGLKVSVTKICELCGGSFTAQKTTTRFCSHACSAKAYKEAKREVAIKSVKRETSIIEVERPVSHLKEKEYFNVAETALLLGVSKQTVYNMIYSGVLKAAQITVRLSIISKKDIDNMLESNSEYRARPKRDSQPITEFYTIAEIKEKFGVKEAWIFKIVKEKRIPKVLRKGKSYISKSHIDNHFAKHAPDQSIEQWYTPTEIQEKFSMSLNAIYSFVYENAIPKKKEGRNVFYSKKHFDIAKGAEKPLEPKYYSVEEAMQKFGVTRDALYNQIKTNKIPKIKEGRYIKISKPELDNLYEEPIIL